MTPLHIFSKDLSTLLISHLVLKTRETLNVLRCAIWYDLHNLQNVENTPDGMILLVKLQGKPRILLKVIFLHGCFTRSFKLQKWYQLAQSISRKTKHQKIYERLLEKYTQKRKQNLLHMDFICTDFLVHPLTNKSRRMTLVQRRYLPVLYSKKKTGIHLF